MNFINDKSTKQKTIKKTVKISGVGFKTARAISMSLSASEENSGISFIRNDLGKRNAVTYRWLCATDTGSNILDDTGNNIAVDSLEHLMAALYTCGIDNALVETNGPEAPILDGSTQPFIDLIESAGTQEQSALRKAIWLQHPIIIRDEEQYAVLTPAPMPHITTEMNFPGKPIRTQTFSVELSKETIIKEMAKARTHRFKNELAQLRFHNLALGCSTDNTIIIDGRRVTNKEGLRYKNEYVRHATLDCLGRLALTGAPLLAHLYVQNPDSGFCRNSKSLRSLATHTTLSISATLLPACQYWPRPASLNKDPLSC